ncbi:hypothetical protein AAG570_005187 [Ranatra chinensis]|uniref:Lipase domain-containing protein n=1 Tax=Ranatra chinensis TaxID=642074 RepID=A0ABD0Y1A7_9HEMI
MYRPEAPPPQPPEKVRPKFCLYTRSNPRFDDCQELRYNETDTIARSHLVPGHKLYVIAHGFLEHGNESWIHSLKGQLLAHSDCNVITVDWGGGSAPPYAQAVANIRLVGLMAARLIATLHKLVGLRTEFCHVIGHSLGAHLAGYIGNTLATNYNLTLGRISGLDPAEPHFSHTDPVVRLDPTDAIFVDVVHTDAAPFIQGGLGMDEPVGHVDFYPNSGNSQPGCEKVMSKYGNQENSSIIEVFREHVGCDHVRSYQYYNESIMSSCQFLAVECDSWDNFTRGHCFGCRGPLVCNTNIDSLILTESNLSKPKSLMHPDQTRGLEEKLGVNIGIAAHLWWVCKYVDIRVPSIYFRTMEMSLFREILGGMPKSLAGNQNFQLTTAD